VTRGRSWAADVLVVGAGHSVSSHKLESLGECLRSWNLRDLGQLRVAVALLYRRHPASTRELAPDTPAAPVPPGLLVEDLVRLAVDALLIPLGQVAGLLRLSSA
jgi:hypothetical protein